MSYTSEDIVRQYLAGDWPLASRFHDQAVVLSGSDWIRFYGRSVDEASLAVKARQGGDLIRTTLQLSGATNVVAGSPLVPGSVVVASDSSLGTVYAEADDYAVDFEQALLLIKGDGRLSIGSQVVIWYQPYRLYVVGSDYQVDSARGRIKRLVSGDVSDGESVYLDYTPLYATYSDELLGAAVTEANGTIEREIDPDQQFGADPRLQTAATFRALATLAVSAAGRELASGSAQDRAALAWLKLAEAYTARSEQHLKGFRPPRQSLSNPSHA
ncbi:MAG: hypothetical protein ABIE70_04480 [bacterium]